MDFALAKARQLSRDGDGYEPRTTKRAQELVSLTFWNRPAFEHGCRNCVSFVRAQSTSVGVIAIHFAAALPAVSSFLPRKARSQTLMIYILDNKWFFRQKPLLRNMLFPYLRTIHKLRHLIFALIAVLYFTLPAFGQEAKDTTAQGVSRYMEVILQRAVVAADASDVIKQADEFRREADLQLKAGKRKEATELLRRAGELIAAATPEGDEKRNDPLLQEYLRDVTARLVELSQPQKNTTYFPNSDVTANGITVNNPRVAAFIAYYQSKGIKTLEIGRARLSGYRPVMSRIFREEGVPEWLLAVGFIESTYNTEAESDKKAVGVWQFIPGTGDRYNLQRTAWTDERKHLEKSTRAAARYLRDLYALFGDWLLALASYNWGEGRVTRLIGRTGVRDFWTLAQSGYFPVETSNYIPAVMAGAYLLGLLPPGEGNNLTSQRK